LQPQIIACSRVAPAQPAISRRFTTAAAVSIMAQSPVCGGAVSSARSHAIRSSAPLTFGASTASGPASAAAAKSAPPQAELRWLQRIITRREPKPPARTASTAFLRAASFSSGATASSRSRNTTSQGRLRALSSARWFEAGT
jgi:hypothetical protein